MVRMCSEEDYKNRKAVVLECNDVESVMSWIKENC